MFCEQWLELNLSSFATSCIDAYSKGSSGFVKAALQANHEALVHHIKDREKADNRSSTTKDSYVLLQDDRQDQCGSVEQN